MYQLRECGVIDPPEHDAADAVPESERKKREQDWLRDVIRAKPPVSQSQNGGDSQTGKRAYDEAIAQPNVGRDTMPPQRRSVLGANGQ